MCRIGEETATFDKQYLVCPEQLETFLEAMKYQNASASPFKEFNVKRCMKKLTSEDIGRIRIILLSLVRPN